MTEFASGLLRSFVAVVDHDGVANAARQLGLSQSSLWDAMARLERDVGTALFVDRRRVTLTAAGEHLLPLARDAVNDLTVVEDTVAQATAGRAGELVISAPPGLALSPLPDLLRQLFDLVPGSQVRVDRCPTATVAIEHVRRGDSELALVSTRVASSELELARVGSHEMVLVVPRSWGPTGFGDLVRRAGTPFVTGRSDTSSGVALRAVTAAGVKPRIVVRDLPLMAVPRMVAHDIGAGFVTRAMLNALSGVRVRSVPAPVDLGFPVYVARRRGPSSPLARVLFSLGDLDAATGRHGMA